MTTLFRSNRTFIYVSNLKHSVSTLVPLITRTIVYTNPCIIIEEFLKTYMIPGTKREANPAGLLPPNHFLVAEKRDRWRPLRERSWKKWLFLSRLKTERKFAPSRSKNRRIRSAQTAKRMLSRNALNWIHSDFYKRHKVSPLLSCKRHHHFWWEIRRIKVIKCPPNSSPQGDINNDPNPTLKK